MLVVAIYRGSPSLVGLPAENATVSCSDNFITPNPTVGEIKINLFSCLTINLINQSIIVISSIHATREHRTSA